MKLLIVDDGVGSPRKQRLQRATGNPVSGMLTVAVAVAVPYGRIRSVPIRGAGYRGD